MRSKILKTLAFALLATILVIAAAIGLSPTPAEVQRLAMGSDQLLLSREGESIQALRTDFKKRRLPWLSLSEFNSHSRAAIILAEDRRFYQHWGFDLIGLVRAASNILRGRRVEGASTISMQVTDLIQPEVLLHNEPIRKGSLRRKLRQLLRAVALEARWSKDEILEAYLNLIHLRGEYQGLPAFSQAYFNKYTPALSLPEAAVIATMISSPNQSATQLSRRACQLKQRSNPSDCSDIESTVAQIFAVKPRLPRGKDLAPHLARRIFVQNPSQPILRSTLNLELQSTVSAILERHLRRLKDQNVRDSAAIVIDNASGEVLAYVGATETSQSPHVDGVQAYRQAGSALKPFIYAKGFENLTLTTASILLDEPTVLTWAGGTYRPSNYDKHFYGPVSVREALASSLNVPAVKAVTIVGLHQTYQVLQSIGLTQMKAPDFYGVSMALGAVEVRLEDLANAYRMLANGGRWSPLRFLKEDSTNKTVANRQVFNPETAFLISSILSDPMARAIGFGADSPLDTPFWTAVKTGTSKDYRDNWCFGFSQRYTVAVWAGNFNAEAMQKVSGVSGAGPSWYEIMTHLHKNEPSLAPTPPDNVIAKPIRHAWLTREYTEYFIKGTEPSQRVIEPAPGKRARFVFPTDDSTLVKDPHMDQNHIALFIRFQGEMPPQTRLLLNKEDLGVAVSPHRLDQPPRGTHKLSLVSPDGKVLTEVQFRVR
jgi:penicillin-binding protein 1C